MINNFVWLLVVFLRSILKETVGQTPPPGFRYASYEVIIPKKQTPRYGHEDPLHVTYMLKIEGKNHLLYLRRKKALISKHFPVFTYSQEGDLQVDYPFIRYDCFYHGFVAGKAGSLAAFSTCSGGLSGVLQVENKSYEIEPVQASLTFQHVAYRLEEEKGAIRMKCGLTEEGQLRQTPMIPNTRNVATERFQDRPWWTHKRYAKLVIVVEHQRYVRFSRNETVVALNTLKVIHLANLWYKPLGIQIFLLGLEIWSQRNLINIASKLNVVLGDFNTWRKNILFPRIPHDAGHLFIYKTFPDAQGFAFTGSACLRDFSSAVITYTSTSLFYFTISFAHEQGHILGMKHDLPFCSCGQQKCLMAAYHSNSNLISNCSYNSYYNFITSQIAQCTYSGGDLNENYKLTYCGNKVVEHGEQCDCGSKVECESDPCCQSNCKLRSGVTCASGECCSRCQYLPGGMVCRRSASVCDLPEFCNGTSAWCPEDVYLQDGTPCQDGAYCYHGKCSTHEEQCKMIFGSRATAASEVCFRQLNTRDDRFGNCRAFAARYINCNSRDILCGRIQCENVVKLPSLGEHSTIIQTRVNNTFCWGTDYHHGSRLPDVGAVNDGTPCAKDKICINKECTDISHLKYDCNITKCQNWGICNNHKNCHCDYGRAPPYCLDEGYGGSIDSGPPPALGRKLKGDLTGGFLIPSAVLIVVIISVVGVYYKAKLRQWCILFSECRHHKSDTQL